MCVVCWEKWHITSKIISNNPIKCLIPVPRDRASLVNSITSGKQSELDYRNTTPF